MHGKTDQGMSEHKGTVSKMESSSKSEERKTEGCDEDIYIMKCMGYVSGLSASARRIVACVPSLLRSP